VDLDLMIYQLVAFLMNNGHITLVWM